jgi:isoleucyl-tRNA synthetase
LVKLLAPVLSFTAEETWQVLSETTLAPVSPDAELTIFTQTYHKLPVFDNQDSLSTKWQRIRDIRADVLRELEVLRSGGAIGSSLQAEVDLFASEQDLGILKSISDQLKFVLIVSRADVHASSGELQIKVNASNKQKCARCWHYADDIGTDTTHPEICGRCVTNLAEASSG